MQATVLRITEPINRPTRVLTPRGHYAVAVIRLRYKLADLDGEDRAYIVSLLRDLIDEASPGPEVRSRPPGGAPG